MNQSMIKELRELWNDKDNRAFSDKTLEIMEKYFGQ